MSDLISRPKKQKGEIVQIEAPMSARDLTRLCKPVVEAVKVAAEIDMPQFGFCAVRRGNGRLVANKGTLQTAFDIERALSPDGDIAESLPRLQSTQNVLARALEIPAPEAVLRVMLSLLADAFPAAKAAVTGFFGMAIDALLAPEPDADGAEIAFSAPVLWIAVRRVRDAPGRRGFAPSVGELLEQAHVARGEIASAHWRVGKALSGGADAQKIIRHWESTPCADPDGIPD